MWFSPTAQRKTCLFLLCLKASRGRKYLVCLFQAPQQLPCTLSYPLLSTCVCVCSGRCSGYGSHIEGLTDYFHRLSHTLLSAQWPDSSLVITLSSLLASLDRARLAAAALTINMNDASQMLTPVRHFTYNYTVNSWRDYTPVHFEKNTLYFSVHSALHSYSRASASV